MKHISFLCLAFMLGILANAQSLKVELCNDSIEIKGSRIISTTHSKEDTVLRQIKKKHLRNVMWEGFFMGRNTIIGYDLIETRQVFKVLIKKNEIWEHKELFEYDTTAFEKYSSTSVSISPNGLRMAVVFTDRLMVFQKAYLINENIDLLAEARDCHMKESLSDFKFLPYTNQDFPLPPRFAVSDDGTLFYMLSDGVYERGLFQRLVVLNLITGQQKELVIEVKNRILKWANFLTIEKKELLLFAPVCDKETERGITGFVFWSLNMCDGERLPKAQETKIPQQIFYDWNKKGQNTSVEWGTRTATMSTGDGGFLLINRTVDFFSMMIMENVNKDIVVLHFTSEKICNWGRIIYRDIWSEKVRVGNKKHSSYTEPEFIQIFRLDSSVLIVYHTETSPRLPGPREGRKYKASAVATWITFVSFSGDIVHYDLQIKSQVPVKIESAALPEKKDSSTYVIYLLLKNENSYDVAKIDLKVN